MQIKIIFAYVTVWDNNRSLAINTGSSSDISHRNQLISDGAIIIDGATSIDKVVIIAMSDAHRDTYRYRDIYRDMYRNLGTMDPP